MVDPTLTISIDRTSLDLEPLLLSAAEDGTPLGISAYIEPPRQSRVRYAGESPWIHGLTPVSATWQQSLLNFEAFPDVASELEAKVRFLELLAAVSQFTYLTTVTVNGQADVWRCDMGSVVPESRTLENLVFSDQSWAVTIPVYPFPVTP